MFAPLSALPDSRNVSVSVPGRCREPAIPFDNLNGAVEGAAWRQRRPDCKQRRRQLRPCLRGACACARGARARAHWPGPPGPGLGHLALGPGPGGGGSPITTARLWLRPRLSPATAGCNRRHWQTIPLSGPGTVPISGPRSGLEARKRDRVSPCPCPERSSFPGRRIPFRVPRSGPESGPGTRKRGRAP